MSISHPIVKLPITDLMVGFLNYQFRSQCGNFEMKYMECMEAHGMARGETICADFLHDLRECASRRLEVKRMEAMQAERLRQYKAGERTKEDYYAPSPPLGSY